MPERNRVLTVDAPAGWTPARSSAEARAGPVVLVRHAERGCEIRRRIRGRWGGRALIVVAPIYLVMCVMLPLFWLGAWIRRLVS